MCWCTMAASPCMPMVDGGGMPIIPDAVTEYPPAVAGIVPVRVNILPLGGP